jgi:prepilin-type N-terminal cleavage/methylation domain-containing protein
MDTKGFTLVEVIVVAVIVAILALVGVQMYIGYVNDAKLEVLENSAASAATYLNAAETLGAQVPGDDIALSLSGTGRWITRVGSGDSTVLSAPAGVTIIINVSDKSVSSSDDDTTSTSYKYSQ